MATAQPGRSLDLKTLFTVFKYSIYFLILGNVYVFFSQEVVASVHTFGHGMNLSELGQAFAATIDTASWLVLLMLFELETAAISHEKVRGPLKWTLHGVRGVCYVGIVYSCWGYIAKVSTLSGFEPAGVLDACSLLGSDAFLAVGLDRYVPIDASNCLTLVGSHLLQLEGHAIFAERDSVLAVLRLAWVDAINGVTWVLVSVLLEIDVWLQLHDMMLEPILRVSKILKAIFYAILFAAAVYWGFEGDFVDFWDAFLWLAAFVFIEMNFLEWHAEAEAETVRA